MGARRVGSADDSCRRGRVVNEERRVTSVMLMMVMVVGGMSSGGSGSGASVCVQISRLPRVVRSPPWWVKDQETHPAPRVIDRDQLPNGAWSCAALKARSVDAKRQEEGWSAPVF